MTGHKERILIFGAGVIGGTYAISFIEAGYEVTMLARGERLQTLREKGLQFNKKGETKTVTIQVIEKLEVSDVYDFIFVPVKYEQAESALWALKDNQSKNIVTLINNPSGYEKWEQILGTGRLLPGFPSAGGEIKNGILHSQYGPKLIQKTMFGEIDGQDSERVRKLAQLFRNANIAYSISDDMDAMQKTHVALVAALSKDMYAENGLKTQAEVITATSIEQIAWTMKNYLTALERSGVAINPSKMKMLQRMPVGLLRFLLKRILTSKIATDVLFSDHAVNMSAEVESMNQDLLLFFAEHDISAPAWNTKL
ncbi:ketopantoate reductase family protein [Listeria sp. FSL L7-1582]|uniref:ketopantoate reductase family protein n=1 Tax=Listeria portnoyi TaxID=2713504 RepID=UPI00164E7EF8|nr:2-dehydropantoate 2-reductase N-terminal domain-containing protein [Listeria portnoyi]MBC6307987.1 ketopantoate reductase family protein [Listeria portnoyi]